MGAGRPKARLATAPETLADNGEIPVQTDKLTIRFP